MRHVQRDTFDCSADEWLAARNALIDLFSVQHSASDCEQDPVALKPHGDSAQEADPATQSAQSIQKNQEQVLENTLGKTTAEHLALKQLPPDFKLSVVVPVFNEASTIEQVLHRLFELPIPLEVLIIDDGTIEKHGCPTRHVAFREKTKSVGVVKKMRICSVETVWSSSGRDWRDKPNQPINSRRGCNACWHSTSGN